jgi:hypothetical protein
MTDESTETPTPEEVFGLVADETRFDILRAIRDAESDEPSFAELREEAGVRDSGRFNYHLDKLTDRFVRKTDDGYELTYAGLRVLGAAISGVYTDADAVEPNVSPDYECVECGGAVEASYDAGTLGLTCSECGLPSARFGVPPILVATTESDEQGSVFGRHLLTTIHQTVRGECTVCNARVECSLYDDFGEQFDIGEQYHGAIYECDECGLQATFDLATIAVDHPAVVGFLYEHGYDFRETPVWRLGDLFDFDSEVVSEDPKRVRATITVDDPASIAVTFDEDLTVVDHERV